VEGKKVRYRTFWVRGGENGEDRGKLVYAGAKQRARGEKIAQTAAAAFRIHGAKKRLRRKENGPRRGKSHLKGIVKS